MDAYEDRPKLDRIPDSNVCVDYFKFECVCPFDPDGPTPFVHGLFRILRINPYRFDATASAAFDVTRIYGATLRLMAKPRKTAERNDGEEYFIVEMSGFACREFEQRGGDWPSLFDWLLHNPLKVHCFAKRIDLACDDLSGLVPLQELKEKVYGYQFTSSVFRSFRKRTPEGRHIGQVEVSADSRDGLLAPDDDTKTNLSVIDGAGWSATFGSKASSFQLQIYDKQAERIAVGGLEESIPHWIRFEMRFMRLKAVALLPRLWEAYRNGTVRCLAHSLLLGSIRFFDAPKGTDFDSLARNGNLTRLPVWKPYAEFLGHVEADVAVGSQEQIEMSVARCLKWIRSNWGKTMRKVIVTEGIDGFLRELGKALFEFDRKDHMGNADLELCNFYRRGLLRQDPLSSEEAKDAVREAILRLGFVPEKTKKGGKEGD